LSKRLKKDSAAATACLMEASSCADTQLGVENDAAMSKQTVRKDRVFIGNPSEQNLKIDKGLSGNRFRN
jgi:hypothetical protein